GFHRGVAGLLDLAAVLLQGGVVAGLKLFGGGQAGLHRRRRQRGEERLGHGGVDGLSTDVEVADALAVDQFAGAVAVVAGGGFGRAAVEHGQFAATHSAGGQALQQRGAFPRRAGARLVVLRADVGADAVLVGLVGVPVDEPGVVIGDEDLPLVLAQPTFPDPQVAVGGDVALPACAAEDVRAGVAGMGQGGVHRVVGGLDPGDLREPVAAVAVALQRPAKLVVP